MSEPVFSAASISAITLRKALGQPAFRLDPTRLRHALPGKGICYLELRMPGAACMRWPPESLRITIVTRWIGC